MADEYIVLDGVKIQLVNPDFDGDGKTGGIERIKNRNFDPDEAEIINPSPDSDLIKEMSKDEIEGDMGMSSIDMKANLHPVEITAILCFDSIVGFNFLPKFCLPLTRSKKRLSRSMDFKGSEQLKDMIVGKKEMDSKHGFNIIGNKQQPQQVAK